MSIKRKLSSQLQLIDYKIIPRYAEYQDDILQKNDNNAQQVIEMHLKFLKTKDCPLSLEIVDHSENSLLIKVHYEEYNEATENFTEAKPEIFKEEMEIMKEEIYEEQYFNENTIFENNKLFKCIYCPYSYSRKSDIAQHYKSHSMTEITKLLKQEIISATTCSYIVMVVGIICVIFIIITIIGTDPRYLAIYQENYQNENFFACYICHKQYRRQNLFEKHMQIHEDTLIKRACNICDRTFISNSKLAIHMSTHNAELRFQCQYCGKLFRTKEITLRHEKIHASYYLCDKCGNCYYSKKSMKIHSEIHKQTENYLKIYECLICSKTFSKKGSYISHQKTHVNCAENTVIPKPFKCKKCEKSYSSRRRLKEHERIHENIYICDYCQRPHNRKYGLIQHIKIHTGEKPFQCLFCGKRFVQSQQLNAHTRLHTGEKNYSCHVCHKDFTLRGNLKQHLRTHKYK